MDQNKPLIVDLDGSLLRTDSLQEALAVALRHPRRLWRGARALVADGRAAMKRELAVASVDLTNAPLNDAVVELIEHRALDGGQVVLATGADLRIAESIAARVPGIADVIASDGVTNLTGSRKAAVLRERYGPNGFDYVGNARPDLAVWKDADRAYLATTSTAGTPAWARDVDFIAVLRDPAPDRWKVWLRAIRLHQSLKNVLIFLPMIAAHAFTEASTLLAAVGGFVSFSLMAFAVYLLNDTLDLSADRAHARKRRRPIAAGWISPFAALCVAAGLVVVGIALAAVLGVPFLLVLLVYAVTTTSYSLWLKRVAIVDVVTLALLYMVRIVAGSVVTRIPLSFWFTAVTLFLFLSLALVKRYAEAHQARSVSAAIRGRGYSSDDIHAILALGTAAGVAAVLVMAIYIQSPAVAVLYPASSALWLVIPVFFYWVANLWVKAGRGQMHDDPLVFALRDRASLIAAALILAVFVAASLPATSALFRSVGL